MRFKHSVPFVLLFILPALGITQTTTISSGLWNDAANWSAGVPTNNAQAFVDHDMTLNTDLNIGNGGNYIIRSGTVTDPNGGTAYDIDISGTGLLNVNGNVDVEGSITITNTAQLNITDYDTLRIGENIDIRNSTKLSIEPFGVLIIIGDFTLRNNNANAIDGKIVVGGDLTISNSGTIAGSGNLQVSGKIEINNSATIFGSTSDCSPGPCEYGSGSGLPIELLNFEAELINNNTVKLMWKTVSEINNDYFTIEKASGNRVFNKIATVQGAGNSQSIQTYTFFDDGNVSEVTYYRLTQTDFDGKSSTFNAAMVKPSTYAYESQQLKLYPNPTNTFINIASKFQNYSNIKIFDMQGKLIHSVNDNDNFIAIDVSALKPGNYIVILENDTEVLKEKFVVK